MQAGIVHLANRVYCMIWVLSVCILVVYLACLSCFAEEDIHIWSDLFICWCRPECHSWNAAKYSLQAWGRIHAVFTVSCCLDVPHGEVLKHGSKPAEVLYNWLYVCLSLIEHMSRMKRNEQLGLKGSTAKTTDRESPVNSLAAEWKSNLFPAWRVCRIYCMNGTPWWLLLGEVSSSVLHAYACPRTINSGRLLGMWPILFMLLVWSICQAALSMTATIIRKVVLSCRSSSCTVSETGVGSPFSRTAYKY